MRWTSIEHEREVSALRERLRHPALYLATLGLLFLLTIMDATRAPERQILAKAYVETVRLYQELGRPLLMGRVRCRYVPSCSEYSIAAVRRFGISRGLLLTERRLSRCTRDVPFGKSDPVP